MPHQAHLGLRIAALASSLFLLTGFVTYRTGLWSPQNVVTQNPPNPALNFNSIETEFSLPNAVPKPAELTEVDQLELIDYKSQNVGTVFRLNGGDAINSRQNVVPRVYVDPNGHFDLAGGIEFGVPSAGVTSLTQQDLEVLRRGPGPASSAQLRQDVVTVMSGSKSMVVFPSTLVQWDKAFDKFKSDAAAYFTQRDRNRDGKLTQDELDFYDWKILVDNGAIEKGAVDSEGLLKNYVWIVDNPLTRNRK